MLEKDRTIQELSTALSYRSSPFHLSLSLSLGSARNVCVAVHRVAYMRRDLVMVIFGDPRGITRTALLPTHAWRLIPGHGRSRTASNKLVCDGKGHTQEPR